VNRHVQFLVGVLGVCLGSTLACSQSTPLSPTPGPSAVKPSDPGSGAFWTISGTVWEYGAGEPAPASSSRLFGWVENPGSGHTTGSFGVSPGGQYQLRVPRDTTWVSLFGGSGHQPCAVGFAPTGDTAADLYRVTDSTRLGVNLPTELLSQTPTLSGVVYEATPAGRRPIPNAWVTLDGLGGMGVLIADTMSDAAGRYTLCGVPQRDQTSLVVGAPGFVITYYWFSDFGGRATFDIEMQRAGLPLFR
jgi:hypothetical protein